MQTTPARLGAVIAAAVLCAALGVTPLFAAQSDDEIPGVPLPDSPATGTLRDTGQASQQDYDDVYSVVLGYNDKLTVAMTGESDTDFDLQLYRPGTPAGPIPEEEDAFRAFWDRYGVQASSEKATSTESFWYPASKPGTYSIDVWNVYGTGDYQLTWKVEKLPEPGFIMNEIPATVAWGASVRIAGAATNPATGGPLKGVPVAIQQRAAGATKWANLNWGGKESTPPKLRTSSTGAFSYSVTPSRNTEYRAVVWPHPLLSTPLTGWANSHVYLVSPRPYLSTPSAPTSVKAKTSFSVSGYLQPKHKVGDKDVRLTFYRWDKSDREWDKVKTVRATNKASTTYPTKTRYEARTSLPSKGSWKVVAHIDGDATHTEKTSGARKITVK